MGPGYFVIAIMGCADSGSACVPVATLQTRYDSAAQCSAATATELERNGHFDFPTMLAQCRRGAAAATAQAPAERPVGIGDRRG